MEPKLENLLNDVEKKLLTLLGPRLSNIILFGSHAKGSNDNDSDIDIIALIDDDDLKQYDKEILRINVDLSIKYDVDLSIITGNSRDYQLNIEVIPLYRNIDKEGINIYAA
jgi:predicted nucleotidyltransferase